MPAAATVAPPDSETKNIREKDFSDFSQQKPSSLDYLMFAAKRYGESPMKYGLEYLKLQRKPGRLTLPEYVQYGVCDPAMPMADKETFVSNYLHWPIVEKICDMTWQASTEDKWLCSHILSQTDIAVPETLAVIDASNRSFPNATCIRSAEDLKAFALEQSGRQFFAKEMGGIAGFGALLVNAVEDDRLELAGQGWFSYADVMEKFVGGTSYLVQPVESNHAFMDAFTDHLATVRMCIMVTDAGVRVPFSVLKLPSKGVIVDSFWRPGNLACGVDPETGKILTARTKDPFSTTDHDVHPETEAQIVGEMIPCWSEVLDLVDRCARIFKPVCYQSMDVAITPTGPKLIEINTGGGFDLPQLATGKGFLTEEVREFFRARGFTQL